MTQQTGAAPHPARTHLPGLGWPVLVQVALFAVAAAMTWTRGLTDAAVALPLLGLALGLVGGVVLLVRADLRPRGAALIGLTVLVAALEAAAVVGLVLAYAWTHPGWDLS